MKLIKIAIKPLFVLCFVAITMSFLAENIVVKTFTKEIFSQKVSGYFLDEVVYDLDVGTLERMEDSIRNSKYTEKITAKFIRNIAENVAFGKDNSLDISKEVERLVQENMPEGMPDVTIESTKKYVTENIVDTEMRLEGVFLYSFGGSYLILLKMYLLFTNIFFRIAMLFLCIADIAGLVILEKYNALKIIQVGMIATAIFTAVVFFIIRGLTSFIRQRLSGGWIGSIYLNMMIVFVVVEMIIGLGIFVVRKKYLKRD